EVGQDGDDQFAGVLRPLGDLHGHEGGGPAADAAQHPLLAGQPACHLEAVLVLDLDDFVDHVQVEDGGGEAGAETLDLVLARLHLLAVHLLRDYRAVDRLDGDGLEGGLALFDDFGNAGDGSPDADAGDQDVYLALGVIPDFLGGGAAVDLRVGRVL